MRVVTPGGVELATERFGEDGPPVLLVMGLGAQMLLWPDGFCAALAARGLQVVRFDNRDVGGSTRFDALGVPSVGRTWLRARAGRPVPLPYTLSAMAEDTLGVLDAYGWSRATVVGASMGGMIAQRLAMQAPDRLAGLVSVMSAPRAMVPRRLQALSALLRRPPPGEQGYIEHTVRLVRAIGSRTYPAPEAEVRALAARLYARGPSPTGAARQLAAIVGDGDRAAALGSVRVPALVIHGDEDALIPLAGGRATAQALRAELREVRGMAHDLPAPLWAELTEAIADFAHRQHAAAAP